ncbi:ty3-gypsy retroelement transposase [Cucumis melo var. makuwa]|uniref:Ty3-gypsy retroelement transposase n=1 Tax=Cucumis melo var. makuwa TaxID=1194695 RepID=A0A5A7SPK1_CUCMM|nr:ty3-gypsy retroelement transposase [Cucumis melo var. makuwa]TYJ99903.1 ty3-gypsy retroelement transposase [Cucumis melo var. makuwa]
MEEYRNHFDKLMAPLSDPQDRLAQLLENPEIIRNEANLKSYSGGNSRTITLGGNSTGEGKKEGPSKRLSDAEFQVVKDDNEEFEIVEDTNYEEKELNGGVDVVLGMQWLYSLGMTTSSEESENKIEEVLTTEKSVKVVLKRYEDVFTWPKELPPQRNIEHHIHLKQGTNLVNVRPYRYAFQQKTKMEKLMDEMLKSGVIRPSNSLYSSLVLIVGCHHVRLCKDDIEKMAFRTHEGHYEFMVMPCGLTNASSTFQSLMNSTFRPYLRKFLLVFFDDILIYSKDIKAHLQHLGLVLEILRKNELQIKGNAALPKQAPLTQLPKLGGFKWSEEAYEAFQKLQNAMMTFPVLALPDFSATFEIETDASGYGIGAVLT